MVRVRFAPSPTGPLHIGGVRTALYNYLFARKNGGTFILRIEDTDQTRFVEGAEDYIIESLAWCGITFDEGVREGGKYGPYRQSERKDIYKKYIGTLIENGSAYYAFDTPEELEELRLDYEKKGEVFTYNGAVRMSLRNSLSMSNEEWQKLLEEGHPYVIRFLTEEDAEIKMYDLIRGDIVVGSSTLDDKVLFKSDGMPTYHLANIVDDHLMEITHVIRGEEWLPSLPLHVSLYKAFGWEPPQFAHLPLLLKPTGKGKLSKRDGDKMGFPVFPLFWPYGETARGYREDGYLPEAFVNMLAMLGWNPGTEQEVFSMDELIEAFSVERISKSGARFDPDKAKWFNLQYIHKLSDENLAEEFEELLRQKRVNASKGTILKIVQLVRERITFTGDLWDESAFFFIAPESYDKEAVSKRWKPETAQILTDICPQLELLGHLPVDEAEGKIKEWINEKGYGMGNVMNALRLTLVGELKGPSVFDIIAVLGTDETQRRIERAVNALAH